MIASFQFETANSDLVQMHRDAPEPYQFIMDNIRLDAKEKLVFSYKVHYL